jgi:hypothetical protein
MTGALTEPPRQVRAEPGPALPECSAGFQPALSRHDCGATFKLGHYSKSCIFDISSDQS